MTDSIELIWLEERRPVDTDASINHLWRAVRALERQVMSNTDNEVRLEGDIQALTQAVLEVQNEYKFLKGRAAQGTVTEDDLTGLETALTSLGDLHPDVSSAVESSTGGAGTIGTDNTAIPTPQPAETPTSGPSDTVPSNTGVPAPETAAPASDVPASDSGAVQQ